MDREKIKSEFLSKCAGWTKDGLVTCYNSDLILLFRLYAENVSVLNELKEVIVRYFGGTNATWTGMFRERKGAYYLDINPYPFLRMQRAHIPSANIDGFRVENTLDAMLLVFEHELTHFIERVKYGKTSHGKRFKALAATYFGHDPSNAVGHTLPTKKNSMRNTQGAAFSPGDKVRFNHSGEVLHGVVISVNKRVSVKVSDRGKYFGAKFYVPKDMLQMADAPENAPTENAQEHSGFMDGDKAYFLHEGHILEGLITGITKRATVKVTEEGEFAGTVFYVPLRMLYKSREDAQTAEKLRNSLKNANGDVFYVGDKVCFEHMYTYFEGEIVRVTKRASVRITSPDEFCGKLFYVPAGMLRHIK